MTRHQDTFRNRGWHGAHQLVGRHTLVERCSEGCWPEGYSHFDCDDPLTVKKLILMIMD